MKVSIALISAISALAVVHPASATPGFCDMYEEYSPEYEVDSFRHRGLTNMMLVSEVGQVRRVVYVTTKAKPDSNTRYFQVGSKLWHCNAVTRKAGTLNVISVTHKQK